jgi:hypothetical protein
VLWLLIAAIHAAAAQASPTESQICAKSPSGPVGWWHGEGSEARDEVCLNNGKLVGTASVGEGFVNRGFHFDGQPGFVKVPQSPVLNVDDELTLSFWYRQDEASEFFTCCHGLVTTDFYQIGLADGGIAFSVSTDNGGSFASAVAPSIPAGEWHLVTGTYSAGGDGLKLYIDGELKGENPSAAGPISPMLADSFLAFGSEDGRSSCPYCISARYIHADLDEVKLFRLALTEDEIQNIFKAESAAHEIGWMRVTPAR